MGLTGTCLTADGVSSVVLVEQLSEAAPDGRLTRRGLQPAAIVTTLTTITDTSNSPATRCLYRLRASDLQVVDRQHPDEARETRVGRRMRWLAGSHTLNVRPASADSHGSQHQGRSTLAASSSVAAPCLRSCSRIGGSPAWAARGREGSGQPIRSHQAAVKAREHVPVVCARRPGCGGCGSRGVAAPRQSCGPGRSPGASRLGNHGGRDGGRRRQRRPRAGA
jgi:hypothetical protein